MSAALFALPMLPLLISLAAAQPTDEPPAEAHVQIDWQGHPAMHIPWWMFGKGLTDRRLKRRTWRHQFRQTVSEPVMRDSGVRIFLAAAMAAERAKNPKQARRLILKQLAYVEDFVADHPDHYVLAKTPAEVRQALATTDKMVLVHSIEGGHHLLWDEGDARFWADQGVALVTLIHLRDKELGGSALLDKWVGPRINPKGAKKRRKGQPRGLTELGRQSIVRLDQAGILVDFTHSSPASIADALDVCEAHDIAPVFTHSNLASVLDDEFALTDEQLVRVYKMGGVFSLGISAFDLTHDTSSTLPADRCAGTVQAWAWHHDQVQQTLTRLAPQIFDDPDLTSLSEAQKTHLATGWSSDWNGWLSHSVPLRRCDKSADSALDRKGLAHPGLLPAHWDAVQAEGVDLDPMLRSAERFLQLWEDARGDAQAAMPQSPPYSDGL